MSELQVFHQTHVDLNKINILWEQAENIFKNIVINEPVSVCYSEDHIALPKKYLSYRKVNRAWCLCIHIGGDSESWYPMPQAPLMQRMEAFVGLEALYKKARDNEATLIESVTKAVEQFTSILQRLETT